VFPEKHGITNNLHVRYQYEAKITDKSTKLRKRKSYINILKPASRVFR
jgi:hypothetical protein